MLQSHSRALSATRPVPPELPQRQSGTKVPQNTITVLLPVFRPHLFHVKYSLTFYLNNQQESRRSFTCRTELPIWEVLK